MEKKIIPAKVVVLGEGKIYTF